MEGLSAALIERGSLASATRTDSGSLPSKTEFKGSRTLLRELFSDDTLEMLLDLDVRLDPSWPFLEDFTSVVDC